MNTNRLKFKVDDLVNEMLDHLPVDIWESKTTMFLDPSMGGGQFVKEIERRLREAGHSNKNISQRVFGWEVNTMRIGFAIKKHNLIGTYEVGGLETVLSKKFDVIVGNPPFQSVTDESKRKKHWVTFADFSMDAASIVALVTPSAWRLNNTKYFKDIGSKIKEHLVAYADANEHFNVGENIGYWIWNKNNNNPVEVIDTNPFSSIYQKMLREGDKWHFRDFQKPTSDIDGITFPNEKNDEFNVPMYWTAKQTRYARPKDAKYGGWKVIVNNSGHYYDKSNPDKYSTVDNEKLVGLGAWGIKVPSEEAGNNVLSWVRSKLYIAVVTNMKTGGFNNPFVELKNLGHDKKWTDEEIYEHFNLTQEEINLIEKTVK